MLGMIQYIIENSRRACLNKRASDFFPLKKLNEHALIRAEHSDFFPKKKLSEHAGLLGTAEYTYIRKGHCSLNVGLPGTDFARLTCSAKGRGKGVNMKILPSRERSTFSQTISGAHKFYINQLK